MPGQLVPAAGSVTLSIRGSVGPTAGTDSNFREKLIGQFIAQGFRVVSLDVRGSYGIGVRDYTATAVLSPLGSMTTDRVIAAVHRAAELAGSYTPTVSVTSAGEAEQQAPAPSTVANTFDQLLAAVGQLGGALGKAGSNVADAPKDLRTVLIVAAVGLVVIVGLVAFGPNVGQVARAARRGV